MPDPTISARAVFVSYAREDVAVAQRFAEALRAFGIEVWFDQNELRGGDAWDMSIRGQIRSCALFIPLVSASTEERSEGYFRREWKLAVDRTQDMAGGRAFIVPVVIDETSESGAAVPEEFMRYQWTRLAGGSPTPEFLAQVKRLLDAPKKPSPKIAHPRPEDFKPVAGVADPGRRTMEPASATPATRKTIPGWIWSALTAVVIGIGVAVSVSRKPAPPPVAAPAVSAATPILPSLSRPAAQSIAVLPFANRSNREEDVFFTDGVHDDLLSQISRIRAIKTISRTSVMGYRGTTKNMRTIGAELGVATILEGGVQRSGNQVRINVQLIDAATDTHLWAEIYDRELTAENIFKIQAEVAMAIATALRATLVPEEKREMEKVPTTNLAALEAYFQGQTSVWKSTSAGLQEAEVLYRKAIDLDPGFAQAYAQLAGVHIGQIFFSGLAPETQAARAEPLVAHALALEPRSSSALTALGWLKTTQRQPAEAEAAFRQAIAANPNYVNAYTYYASLLFWTLGRPVEALAMNAKARELEPRNPGLVAMAAEFLIALGRRDEARALLEENTRKAPDFAQSYYALGQLYMENLDRPDLALAALRQGYALDPASPMCAGLVADLYYRIGEPAKAMEWYERTLRLSPTSAWAWVQRAKVHDHKGEPGKAWAIIEAAAFGPAGSSRSYALLLLSNRDLLAGRPQDARARLAAATPALVDSPDPVIDGDNYDAATGLAMVLAATGEKERATRLLNRIKPVVEARNDAVTLALIHAELGDRPQAIAALRRFIGVRGTFDGFDTWLAFRRLEGDPEYQALVKENDNKLAVQRQRLRELEAGGTLAPIPPLPEAKK